jgi:hypothetical protein
VRGSLSLKQQQWAVLGKEESTVNEIEELQQIQREASERRAERDRERLETSEAKLRQTEQELSETGPGTETPSASTPAGGDVAAEAEGPIPAFSHQLGSLLEELEEAARERPAVALLAAFSLGVIVGQLFSRK